MANVSRPLIGLLVATVVFFALWIVALKPSGSSSGGGQGLGQYQSAINKAKASVASQNRAAAAANATSVTGSSTSGAGSSGAGTAGTASTAGTARTAASPAVTSASPAATTKPVAKTTATASHARVHAATTTTTTHQAGVHAAATTTATTAHHARVHTATAATAAQRVSVVDRALAGHKVLALLVYNPAAPDDRAVKQELARIPASRGRVVKLAIPVTEVTNYPVITSQVQITSSPTLVIIDRSAQAFTLVGFADGFEIAHRIGDALSLR